jgi:hypothetical protein
MRSRTRTSRDARTLGNTMAAAGANARKSSRLALAAGQVIAKRLALGAAAMVDPLAADHAEFARIIPEKALAFSETGMIWLQRSGAVAEQMGRFAASEMAIVAKAAADIAGCRTPAGVIAAQSRFATAWFARALSRSIALGSLAMRSQGAAIAPMHKAATANARRLRR